MAVIGFKEYRKNRRLVRYFFAFMKKAKAE